MPAEIDSHYLRTRPTRLWSRLLSYALYEGRPLTTRGRWINPVVFANHALAQRLPKLKTVKAPIFIIGTGRSGTTALGVVLSMHRDVGYLNEPKSVWHAVHGGEDLIGSYSRGEARYRLDAAEAGPKQARAIHRIYGAYLRVTGTKRVVDKYPELLFRFPFVKALFPDAKFLFLARNGWDTIHSITGWSKRLGVEKKGEAHNWWGADDRKWQLLVSQIVPEHPDLSPHQADMLGWENPIPSLRVMPVKSCRRSTAESRQRSIRFCNRPSLIPWHGSGIPAKTAPRKPVPGLRFKLRVGDPPRPNPIFLLVSCRSENSCSALDLSV